MSITFWRTQVQSLPRVVFVSRINYEVLIQKKGVAQSLGVKRESVKCERELTVSASIEKIAKTSKKLFHLKQSWIWCKPFLYILFHLCPPLLSCYKFDFKFEIKSKHEFLRSLKAIWQHTSKSLQNIHFKTFCCKEKSLKHMCQTNKRNHILTLWYLFFEPNQDKKLFYSLSQNCNFHNTPVSQMLNN